jgi:hypothetical protein
MRNGNRIAFARRTQLSDSGESGAQAIFEAG